MDKLTQQALVQSFGFIHVDPSLRVLSEAISLVFGLLTSTKTKEKASSGCHPCKKKTKNKRAQKITGSHISLVKFEEGYCLTNRDIVRSLLSLVSWRHFWFAFKLVVYTVQFDAMNFILTKI